MKEELLKTLLDLVNSTKELVISQAPDVIRQYIIGEYISIISWVLLLTTFSIIAAKITKYGYGISKNESYSEWGIGYFFCGAIAAVFVLFDVIVISEMLTLYFAPKAYLLKELIYLGRFK